MSQNKIIVTIIIGAIVLIVLAIAVAGGVMVIQKRKQVPVPVNPVPAPGPMPMPSPAPAPVPVPAPISANSKWAPVMNRSPSDSAVEYMGKIYDAIVGDPIGFRHAPYEGGVTSEQAEYLGEATTLDRALASRLCENPCYWYYNNGNEEQKAAINNAGLCYCVGTPTAINF